MTITPPNCDLSLASLYFISSDKHRDDFSKLADQE
jgi:hypothetical protein